MGPETGFIYICTAFVRGTRNRFSCARAKRRVRDVNMCVCVSRAIGAICAGVVVVAQS